MTNQAHVTLKERYLAAKKALFDQKYSFLNNKQREAVYHIDGPLLVLAGAGTGKTTLLVNRIAYILKYGNAYNSDYVPYFTDDDITVAQNYIQGKTDTLPYGVFAVNAPRPWLLPKFLA